MAEPFNYCPRCGEELEPWESEKAQELHQNGLPPLCHQCVMEVFQNVAKPLASLVADIHSSMRNAFQPLIELAEDLDQPDGENE